MDGFIEPSIGSDNNQNNRVCPLGEHFTPSSARGATSRKPILGATAAVCTMQGCMLFAARPFAVPNMNGEARQCNAPLGSLCV